MAGEREKNRKQLTEYWESKGVKFDKHGTIDDCVVVPGEPADWLFHPFAVRIKRRLRKIFRSSAR